MFGCVQRPITLNGGMKMTGWFDILSLDKIKMKEDQAGLEDAQRYCISTLIAMVITCFMHDVSIHYMRRSLLGPDRYQTPLCAQMSIWPMRIFLFHELDAPDYCSLVQEPGVIN